MLNFVIIRDIHFIISFVLNNNIIYILFQMFNTLVFYLPGIEENDDKVNVADDDEIKHEASLT